MDCGGIVQVLVIHIFSIVLTIESVRYFIFKLFRMQGPTAVITSPGYPSNYPNNTRYGIYVISFYHAFLAASQF
jgi:hypothetical protein